MDKTLADLVAGDEVGLFHGRHEPPHIAAVTRTTLTQIIIGGLRFNRAWGHQVGAPGYQSKRIKIASEDVRAQIAEMARAFEMKRRCNLARNAFEKVRVDESNIERVEAFLASLDSPNPKD